MEYSTTNYTYHGKSVQYVTVGTSDVTLVPGGHVKMDASHPYVAGLVATGKLVEVPSQEGIFKEAPAKEETTKSAKSERSA